MPEPQSALQLTTSGRSAGGNGRGVSAGTTLAESAPRGTIPVPTWSVTHAALSPGGVLSLRTHAPEVRFRKDAPGVREVHWPTTDFYRRMSRSLRETLSWAWDRNASQVETFGTSWTWPDGPR